MLKGPVRRILAWITVAVAAVVVIGAVASVVQLLSRPRAVARALQIVPPEANLCPGQTVDFETDPPLSDVEWAATGGGEISPEGHYVAGDVPGDYEVQAAGPGGERGRALVHVIPCTPTPTPTLPPTPTPSPTPAPTPTPLPPADPQGDVAYYTSGEPVEPPIAGLDIQNASVAPDLRIALTAREGLPAGLAEWAQEGEAVLWISLYEPLPETPLVNADWLFVLDVDGDPTTGRPPGTRPINTDLGDEAAVGLYYTLETGAYAPFLSVWDPTQEAFVSIPAEVRFFLSEDRRLIGLAVPLATLRDEVARMAGATLVPDAVRGRAAAIAFVVPEPIADLYPDPAR